MKIIQTALPLIITGLLLTSCQSTEKEIKEPCLSEEDIQKGMIELSGDLHRPMNGPPQIYLGEYGNIRRIELKGEKIKSIPSGTPIKIFGFMRSKYFEGGTDADQLAMPAQWKLWFDVKSLEIISDDN